MFESILVAEMSEEELIEERAEVLQRIRLLRAGCRVEGSPSELKMRLARIDSAIARRGYQQMELEL